MIDFFGKDAIELKEKKLWLFDLDGTIYADDKIFEGSIELLMRIVENNGRYVFVTNNSSCSVYDYITRVNKLGIQAEKDNFFTSSQTMIYFLKNKYSNARVYCQGTKSFIKELMNAEINVTTDVENVDIVVVGFDTELSSGKIRNTCEVLSKQNVIYLATNPDLVCPVSFGFIPDCGSICQMIENATGRTPLFLGKPEPTMVHKVCEKFGMDLEETVIVGDRLYTDIAMGINADITSVAVLTGEVTEEEIIKGKLKPTYTFSSVKEITI